MAVPTNFSYAAFSLCLITEEYPIKTPDPVFLTLEKQCVTREGEDARSLTFTGLAVCQMKS